MVGMWFGIGDVLMMGRAREVGTDGLCGRGGGVVKGRWVTSWLGCWGLEQVFWSDGEEVDGLGWDSWE